MLTLILGGCAKDEKASSDGGGSVQTPQCPGEESSITGTVLAPNGADPVPGATVFIPSADPEAFPPRVACEACGNLGDQLNLWIDISKFDGTFAIQGVCPGEWPLVLQNGRFRRVIQIEVSASSTVQIPEDQSRLPGRAQEFGPADAVPRIAVATGDYDKMECVLRKMGLQDGQFDLYEGATFRAEPAAKGLPFFFNLVKDLEQMKSYNVIFINCTSDTYEEHLKMPQVLKNLSDYVNAGGRLYVTDWSYDWIERVEAFSPFIDFEPGPSDDAPEPFNAAALGEDGLTVQGKVMDEMMAKWLGLFPGAISNGLVPIEHFLTDWVIMHMLGEGTKLWVEGQISSGDGSISGVRPLTMSFTFKNCGKILFTSYHTEGREDEGDSSKGYPNYCTDTFLPQERLLEYLIFHIAQCVPYFE